MSATMHVICSARAVACIVHNTCLHWLQHLLASATTPLIYIGQNISLHRPKHLFTSASAVTCIGHNTSHLRPQKYWPAPATTVKIPVYVSQSCDLHQPQHLSFTSVTTSIYIGQNTCLCRPQHLLTSASAVTCIGHNTSYLCQQRFWPAPAKTQVTTLACVSKNTGLRRP